MKFRFMLWLHIVFVWISDIFTGLAFATDKRLYPKGYGPSKKEEEETNEQIL